MNQPGSLPLKIHITVFIPSVIEQISLGSWHIFGTLWNIELISLLPSNLWQSSFLKLEPFISENYCVTHPWRCSTKGSCNRMRLPWVKLECGCLWVVQWSITNLSWRISLSILTWEPAWSSELVLVFGRLRHECSWMNLTTKLLVLIIFGLWWDRYFRSILHLREMVCIWEMVLELWRIVNDDCTRESVQMGKLVLVHLLTGLGEMEQWHWAEVPFDYWVVDWVRAWPTWTEHVTWFLCCAEETRGALDMLWTLILDRSTLSGRGSVEEHIQVPTTLRNTLCLSSYQKLWIGRSLGFALHKTSWCNGNLTKTCH